MGPRKKGQFRQLFSLETLKFQPRLDSNPSITFPVLMGFSVYSTFFFGCCVFVRLTQAKHCDDLDQIFT